MAYVQARARGVRKLYQRIELGLGKVVFSFERARLVPDLLPFFLDFGGVILFLHTSVLLRRIVLGCLKKEIFESPSGFFVCSGKDSKVCYSESSRRLEFMN